MSSGGIPIFLSVIFAYKIGSSLQGLAGNVSAYFQRIHWRDTSNAEVAIIDKYFGGLKTTPRTGWLNNMIPSADCESVADHSWRMSMMVMLYSPEANWGQKLSVEKMVMMCVIHDLAETITGDITPEKTSGISPAEQKRREHDAMEKIISALGERLRGELRGLWIQYEDQKTPEAQFVKDVDRIEMLSQAIIYERKFPSIDLSTFFESTMGKARFPQTKAWDAEVRKLRSRR